MHAAVSAPRGAAGGPLTPCRRHCLPTAARLAAAAPRPSRPRRLAVAASGGKPISEADLYQAVAPSGQLPPSPQSALLGQPWYITAPLAFVGLVAALRLAKAAKKKMSPSNRLAERGFKKGEGVADEGAYSRAMKNMKRVNYDLTDEQINAARKRRQREVDKDSAPMDLEQIELPDNHPFAVRKKLAPEDQEIQRNRFSARRGLSTEDMQRLREQQALADQLDAEGEARQEAMRRQQRGQ